VLPYSASDHPGCGDHTALAPPSLTRTTLVPDSQVVDQAYGVVMEGIRPRQIHMRRICEALIKDPDKVWSPRELAQVGGCSVRAAKKIVHWLWMNGAVEHVRNPPCPVGQVSAVNPQYVGSSQRLKAANEGERIRGLLACGRPQSVIGMWVWEGRGKATALWQAKRRARDWRRRNQAQPPENISRLYRSDRITRITGRLAGRYRRWVRWYWPDRRSG
jgi:hypothetical protein